MTVAELLKLCKEAVEDVERKFDYYEITEAIEKVIALVDAANKYVNDKAPWSLAKTDLKECEKVLYSVLEVMKYASVLLYPVIPNIAQKIYAQLGFDGDIKNVKLADLNNISIKDGQVATKETISPVFLRLDSEIAKDKKK